MLGMGLKNGMVAKELYYQDTMGRGGIANWGRWMFPPLLGGRVLEEVHGTGFKATIRNIKPAKSAPEGILAAISSDCRAAQTWNCARAPCSTALVPHPPQARRPIPAARRCVLHALPDQPIALRIPPWDWDLVASRWSRPAACQIPSLRFRLKIQISDGTVAGRYGSIKRTEKRISKTRANFFAPICVPVKGLASNGAIINSAARLASLEVALSAELVALELPSQIWGQSQVRKTHFHVITTEDGGAYGFIVGLQYPDVAKRGLIEAIPQLEQFRVAERVRLRKEQDHVLLDGAVGGGWDGGKSETRAAPLQKRAQDVVHPVEVALSTSRDSADKIGL
ncbi:hypothetical protein B0H13DRAFT_1913550 [Mycena leptocephala]|nr:hypothetical protein B0H13DRAFT_1913550 [Mycena leptocephala]